MGTSMSPSRMFSNTPIRLLVIQCVLLTSLLGVSSVVSAAPTDPLVLVIHGIGGGNREEGWSTGIADRWMIPVKEITFRQEGRDKTSLTDFAQKSGEWALEVQRQIKEAVEANPGRKLIIVSHSWGTVATKIALGGGLTNGGDVPKIDLGGVEVEEWITLGSPLGQAESTDVVGLMLQERVQLPQGKPSIVRNWTNIYDEADPVSRLSHNLEGAENIGVSKSGWWFDVTGLTAHTGLWKNTAVSRFVQQKFWRLADEPALPASKSPTAYKTPTDSQVPESTKPSRAPETTKAPEAGTGQVDQRYQKLAGVLIEVHNRDCAARRAKWGGDYRIEYTVSPAPRQKNGRWYVVAAWKLLEKAPGRDNFFPVFEAGDAANPQWLDEAAIVALAKQWGVPWQ